MRKFLAIITVLVFGFVMVACTPSVKETDLFLSANKLVYSQDEINGTVPKVELTDFNLFGINSDRTVTIKTVTLSEVTIQNNTNNIFTISVAGKSYDVYLANESSQTGAAVIAVSPTYGVDDDSVKIANVQRLLFTPIANKVNLEGIKVISADFSATSNNDVKVTDASANGVFQPAATYSEDIFNQKNDNVFQFNFNGLTTEVINKTFKPADNQLPINPKMKLSFIGYVWDWLLIIPIAFIMQLFASIFGNSFAVGILFATLIVRTLAWPIYARTNDMSMKMAVAQPEMNKLQAKYAMKKDPASQQKMQMEMMAIYKKHKISMFGCLMPILQMPLFLAMFQVVYRIQVSGGIFTNAVSNKTLLGFIDLTIGGFNDVWSYVLAAIVGFTMWYLQKLSSKKPSYAKNTGNQVKTDQQLQTENTMKTVSFVMVGMMVLTTLTSVNALGFYWVVGNIYSLVQSIINRRVSEKKYQKTKQSQSII